MEEKEDFNFDFSMYEKDSEEDIPINKERPALTFLKSRFSLGQSVMDDISFLRSEITKVSIGIEGGSQDIADYKKLFGLLNETWNQILHTQGTESIKKIEDYQKKCWEYLLQYNNKTIPREIQKYFLKYRKEIYALLAWCNLSFDVERTGQGSSAKRKIVE